METLSNTCLKYNPHSVDSVKARQEIGSAGEDTGMGKMITVLSALLSPGSPFSRPFAPITAEANRDRSSFHWWLTWVSIWQGQLGARTWVSTAQPPAPCCRLCPAREPRLSLGLLLWGCMARISAGGSLLRHCSCSIEKSRPCLKSAARQDTFLATVPVTEEWGGSVSYSNPWS